MVVAYRVSPLTAFLLRTAGTGQGADTFRCRICSPDGALVPEFLQEQVTGAALADGAA